MRPFNVLCLLHFMVVHVHLPSRSLSAVHVHDFLVVLCRLLRLAFVAGIKCESTRKRISLPERERERERLLFFNCHLPYLRQLFRTSSGCLQLPLCRVFVFRCNCCSCRDVLRISGLTLTRCGLPENNKQTLASVIALPAILSVGVCKRRAQ